jgi:hypothetical protein
VPAQLHLRLKVAQLPLLLLICLTAGWLLAVVVVRVVNSLNNAHADPTVSARASLGNLYMVLK